MRLNIIARYMYVNVNVGINDYCLRLFSEDARHDWCKRARVPCMLTFWRLRHIYAILSLQSNPIPTPVGKNHRIIPTLP